MGTLYVLLGASGIGKDFIADSIVDFSENYRLPDGSKKEIIHVQRLLSRKERKFESKIHRYSVPVSEICSPSNFYSTINKAYVGINKESLKTDLANGKNLIFVTGSTDMIDQLTTDPDLTDSLCLIFINGPGYGIVDYFALELDRNKGKSLDELKTSAKARYDNSLRVSDYYQRNYDFFDYAMLNVPPRSGDIKARELSEKMMREFYKTIIENNHQSGPCWVTSTDTRRRSRK